MEETVENSDMLIFVIPSVYLKDSIRDLPADISNKYVVSAIKGIVPDDNILIADYFAQQHKVDPGKYAVITGPSHAELVAMEKLSFLTIAAGDREVGELLAEQLRSSYIQATVNEDVYGAEYSAALKNIMAIAAGICNSLNYGDNFQAVLISNAIQEMERFLEIADPRIRDIKGSAYLGDLLVTAYSQFSRNRTFGAMVGKGYSVESAIMEMNMVAEGYHAVKCIHEINQRLNTRMPITEAVYNILYEKIAPGIAIRLLTEQLS
jgi:glycerol-3-phosphate dehydrogenase (NAD(P)+)